MSLIKSAASLDDIRQTETVNVSKTDHEKQKDCKSISTILHNNNKPVLQFSEQSRHKSPLLRRSRRLLGFFTLQERSHSTPLRKFSSKQDLSIKRDDPLRRSFELKKQKRSLFYSPKCSRASPNLNKQVKDEITKASASSADSLEIKPKSGCQCEMGKRNHRIPDSAKPTAYSLVLRTKKIMSDSGSKSSKV